MSQPGFRKKHNFEAVLFNIQLTGRKYDSVQSQMIERNIQPRTLP